MLGQFKVLHLNTAKRKQCHWSLMCDEQLSEFDALATVEPYMYEDPESGEPMIPTEKGWQLFVPSVKQAGEARNAFRAALWVSSKHTARAIAVPFSRPALSSR